MISRKPKRCFSFCACRLAPAKPVEECWLLFWFWCWCWLPLRLSQSKNQGQHSSSLGEKTAKPAPSGSSNSAKLAELGISVRPLTKEEANALNNKDQNGLIIVSLEADKPASQAGLQEGDILLSANLKELKTNEDLNQIIKTDADKKGAVMFKVMRRGQTFFIAVTLKK